MDFSKYNKTEKTVTFSNGKTFHVYSRHIKTGMRFYYFSPGNNRMMPVSKKDIN